MPPVLTNVLTAFEILLEEVENEIEFINAAGAKAFTERNYTRVEATREQALKLAEFRDKTALLRQEWQQLVKDFQTSAGSDDFADSARRNLGRLKRGARTPEDAYRIPILRALIRLGGTASIRDVMVEVERQMKSELKDVDYEPLPSIPAMSRWRNTAQWARVQLIREGLMKSDSAHGIWEISDSGRRFMFNK